MAEILAVVSGGLSIAAFALQLSEKIVQIRDFLNASKLFPAEIQQHLQDIHFLNKVLLSLDSQNQANFADKTSRLCAEQCRHAADLASTLLSELQTKAAKRKMLGSALKRGDVMRLLARLESIKSTLNIALIISQRQHQSYMLEWAERQNNAMQILVTQVSSNSALNESKPSSTSSRNLTLPGSQHRTSRTPTFRLALPTWLSGRVWEIYTSRAQIEWAFRLRTYNIIPGDSVIFKYARIGDVEGLEGVLNSNQGSVFDCDSSGETALHIAACHGQVTSCQLLLDRGADACARDKSWMTPLHNALLWGGPFRHRYRIGPIEQNSKEVISKLLPRTRDGILENERNFLISNDLETLQVVMTNIEPPFYQRSLSERLELLEGTFYCFRKANLIPLVLTSDERQNMSSYRHELLPLAILSCVATVYKCPAEVDGYHALFANIFRGYPNQQEDPVVSNPPTSFLMEFLRLWVEYSFGKDPYQKLQKGNLSNEGPNVELTPMRLLARSLHIAGVDLLRFGRVQEALLADGLVDRKMTRTSEFREIDGTIYLVSPVITIRLIAFNYGPKPEDWFGWYSNFRDEYAGEFWDMLANAEPEMSIPGSWVD